MRIEMATLLAGDGRDWRQADADAVLTILSLVATPADGIEHIRSRHAGNRIEVVVFQADEFASGDPGIVQELIRRAENLLAALERGRG